eukprot:12244426-Prorocentrum_lima.AAC.1
MGMEGEVKAGQPHGVGGNCMGDGVGELTTKVGEWTLILAGDMMVPWCSACKSLAGGRIAP